MNDKYVITKYTISSTKISKDIRPVRAAVLSDLHDKSYGINNKRLLSHLQNINPDMVLLPGDMVTCGKSSLSASFLNNAERLIESLASKYPVFYSPGNHESYLGQDINSGAKAFESYKKRLIQKGVYYLDNKNQAMSVRGQAFTIYGLEIDILNYRKIGRSPQLKLEEIKRKLGNPSGKNYNILLAHNPVYFKEYASWGADLSLSGHLHGGIVRLPVLGGVISPQMKLFPQYDRGLFKLGQRKLIVSAGLGEHTIPIRINNPPELIVIEFKNESRK